jgi:hypothetical protein
MRKILTLAVAALAAASSAIAITPDIGSIKQASGALSKTDPNLAQGLSGIANRDAGNAKRGVFGSGNTVQDQKDAQTLNTAADKLQKANPNLSDNLRMYSNHLSTLNKARGIKGVKP